MDTQQLTYKEAQAVLNELNGIALRELLNNPALLSAAEKLNAIKATVTVSFDCGMSNKVHAIKLLRELTHKGLKEAKEYVEAAWATGDPIIHVGEVTQERLDAVIKQTNTPGTSLGWDRPDVRWYVK